MDRFPLVLSSNEIRELPSGDNLDLSNSSIVNASSISANIITVNGQNVLEAIDWTDIQNAPSIPTSLSQLTNDIGLTVDNDFNTITNTPTTLAGYGITDAATDTQGALAVSALQPGSNISQLNNDSNFITIDDVAGEITVNPTGDLQGSVYADDSTLLVDGVNSKINLQNTVLNNTMSTSDENFLINTAATPGERGLVNLTTTDNILDIQGAAALPEGQGGGVYINGGIPSDDPSDYTRYGDIVISGRIVSILAGDNAGGGGVTFGGPVIGTTAMDIKGSVFGDDSTLLVDGVNGTISWTVISDTPTTIAGYGITDAFDGDYNSLSNAPDLTQLDGDLKGSVFGDDSTLLVDGVAGKIVGDYTNGSSTIGSTRVESYDINALQDTNTIDSYVAGTIYGGETGNIKNLVVGSTAPSTSNGAADDRSGMIAFDSTYIYYCTADYTDGVADIWKRVAWSGDTW